MARSVTSILERFSPLQGKIEFGLAMPHDEDDFR
jgi:hypothetical protein